MTTPPTTVDLVEKLYQYSQESREASRSTSHRFGHVVRIITNLLFCSTSEFNDQTVALLRKTKNNFQKAKEPQPLLNRLLTRIETLSEKSIEERAQVIFLDTLFKSTSSPVEAKLKKLLDQYKDDLKSDRERVVVLDVLTRSINPLSSRFESGYEGVVPLDTLTRSIDQENKLNAIEQSALLAQAAQQKEVPFFEAVVIYAFCGVELGERVFDNISTQGSNKDRAIKILYNHFSTLGAARGFLKKVFENKLDQNFHLDDLLYMHAHLPSDINLLEFIQYVREDGKISLLEAVRALQLFPEEEREKQFLEVQKYPFCSVQYGLFNRLRFCAFQSDYIPDLKLFANRDELERALALIEGQGDKPLWMVNPSIRTIWEMCHAEEAKQSFVEHLERRLHVYAPTSYHLANVGGYLNGPTEFLLALLRKTTSMLKESGPTKERLWRTFALIGELFSRQGVTPQDVEGMFDWSDNQAGSIPHRLNVLIELFILRVKTRSTWENKEEFFDVITQILSTQENRGVGSVLQMMGVDRFSDEKDMVDALAAQTILDRVPEEKVCEISDRVNADKVESVAADYRLPVGLALVLTVSFVQVPIESTLSPSDPEEAYRCALLLRLTGQPRRIIFFLSSCDPSHHFSPSVDLAFQMRLGRDYCINTMIKIVGKDASVMKEVMRTLALISCLSFEKLEERLDSSDAEEYGAFNLFRAQCLAPAMEIKSCFSSKERFEEALDLVYRALRSGVKQDICRRIWQDCVQNNLSEREILAQIKEQTVRAILSIRPFLAPQFSQAPPRNGTEPRPTRLSQSFAAKALGNAGLLSNEDS